MLRMAPLCTVLAFTSCDVLFGTLCDSHADCEGGQVCDAERGTCVGPDRDSPNPSPSGAGSIGERYEEAHVERWLRCEGAQRSYAFYQQVEGHPKDNESWLRHLEGSTGRRRQAIIEHASTSADLGRAEEWIRTVELEQSKPCDQSPQDIQWAMYRRIFAGTRTEGDGCSLDEQCVGDLACARPDGICGTCVPRGAEGAPCDGSAPCAFELQCREGQCRRDDVPLGEACVPFQCAGHADCLEGICVPQAKLGESCADVRCTDAGPPVYCAAPDATCELVIEGQEVGDPCTPLQGRCGIVEDTGLACVLQPDSEDFRCQDVDVLALGDECVPYDDAAVCASFDDAECAYDDATFGRSCQAKADTNEACDNVGCRRITDRCVLDGESWFCKPDEPFEVENCE